MPSIPDIPGKGVLVGTTRRTRVVAAAAGTGVLAVGGLVAKRIFGGDEAEKYANADPIAQMPTAPPGAEEKPTPKPKAAKPKSAKPKAAKPKAPEPPAAPGTVALPKPLAKPGNQTGGKGPHHALNNPVVDDPDMTEYPDPYETREDPRDPVDPDGAPFGEEPHPPTGAESTSEPPPSQDPEVGDRAKPPRRDNLDE